MKCNDQKLNKIMKSIVHSVVKFNGRMFNKKLKNIIPVTFIEKTKK